MIYKHIPKPRTAEELGLPGPYAQVRLAPVNRPRLAIRGDIIAAIAAQSQRDNPHQIAKETGISYPTTRRYLIAPGTDLKNEPKGINLEVLLDILLDGAGLSWIELANLPFGAIFAVVDHVRPLPEDTPDDLPPEIELRTNFIQSNGSQGDK